MKCQILFSGKNKKNIINLSSAENAQRVVKVNERKQQHRKKRRKEMNRDCQQTKQIKRYFMSTVLEMTIV